MTFVVPLAIRESKVSKLILVLPNTDPTSSKSFIDVAMSISANQSVACRRWAEQVITSRRNDVFQFLNRVTGGHCSNSSLSISIVLVVESLSRDLPV